MYRLGEVPFLSTPNPTADGVEHRFSTHLSYIGHDERRDDYDVDREQSQSARQSIRPPLSAAITDNTRSSYLTSVSSNSRISQLSDFPAPPTYAQDVISPGQIIQSYFNATPTAQKDNPMDFLPSTDRDEPTVTIPRTRTRSTTFGDEEVPILD